MDARTGDRYGSNTVRRLPPTKLLHIARKMNGPIKDVFDDAFFEEKILVARVGFQKLFIISDATLIRAMLQRPANFDRSESERLQAGDLGDSTAPYGTASASARENMNVVFKKDFSDLFYRTAVQIADHHIEMLPEPMTWKSVYHCSRDTAKWTTFRAMFGDARDLHFTRFVDLVRAADDRMIRFDALKLCAPRVAKFWSDRSKQANAVTFNTLCATLLEKRQQRFDSAGVPVEILPSTEWLLSTGSSTNYCNTLGLFLLMSDNLVYSIYWMIHCLSSAPDVYARAFAEAQRVDTDELLDAGRPQNYLDAVVDETLRVRPPLPMMGRVYRPTPDMPEELTQTCNRLGLRKEDAIVISPWILHHHKAYWQDPTAFDPDRFAIGKNGADNPAYLPFGFGRRRCPGARMATRTLAIVLQRFLRRFPILPLPPSLSQPLFYLSLLPSDVRALPQ
jgi:cytochrome P450